MYDHDFILFVTLKQSHPSIVISRAYTAIEENLPVKDSSITGCLVKSTLEHVNNDADKALGYLSRLQKNKDKVLEELSGKFNENLVDLKFFKKKKKSGVYLKSEPKNKNKNSKEKGRDQEIES